MDEGTPDVLSYERSLRHRQPAAGVRQIFCTNMRGASPLTTIHEPAKVFRSIVVRPLAGLMLTGGSHAHWWVSCSLVGLMLTGGSHASRPRLQKFDAHPPTALNLTQRKAPRKLRTEGLYCSIRGKNDASRVREGSI